MNQNTPQENKSIEDNQSASMTRGEMESNRGYVNKIGIIFSLDSDQPMTTTTGEHVVLDLSEKEIEIDLQKAIEINIENQFKDIITQNGLIAINDHSTNLENSLVSVQYLSKLYISELPKKTQDSCSELGVNLDEPTKNSQPKPPGRFSFSIDESLSPMENSIKFNLATNYSENFDRDGNATLPTGSISNIDDLVRELSTEFTDWIKSGTQKISKDAAKVKQNNPNDDTELEISELPDLFIEGLDPKVSELSVGDQQKILSDIRSSAKNSESNLAAKALLPVALLLQLPDIEGDIDYETAKEEAMDIVRDASRSDVVPAQIKEALLGDRIPGKTMSETITKPVISPRNNPQMKVVTISINIEDPETDGIDSPNPYEHLENMELPSGYVEGSYKEIDPENGNNNPTINIEIKLNFPDITTNQQVLSYLESQNSTPPNSKITIISTTSELLDESRLAIDPISFYEKTYLDFYAGESSTTGENQALSAVKALMDLSNTNPRAKLALSYIYKQHSAPVFDQLLYQGKSKEEELLITQNIINEVLIDQQEIIELICNKIKYHTEFRAIKEIFDENGIDPTITAKKNPKNIPKLIKSIFIETQIPKLLTPLIEASEAIQSIKIPTQPPHHRVTPDITK